MIDHWFRDATSIERSCDIMCDASTLNLSLMPTGSIPWTDWSHHSASQRSAAVGVESYHVLMYSSIKNCVGNALIQYSLFVMIVYECSSEVGACR